jgi:asparagine synthase (glutamine-hydrolysing)
MCGICGIISFNNQPIQESSIRRMMEIQKHRGPDDEGVFLEDKVGLGFVRLSILDLSTAGHQPMFSRDGRYVIVFNGEVFNYIELREELRAFGYDFNSNTDTEVVLAAYQRWGEDCLNRFNGMWSFAIYDRQKSKIFGARDRFGIKPFYYLHKENFFAFASEISPLLSLLERKPVPDKQSIFDYLVFNRTDQTDRTFFSEIKKLQHGNFFYLNISGATSNSLSISKWYNLRDKVKQNSGFQSPHEFKELLDDSISLRLRSDVPLGVCLSGGLDSSAITSSLLLKFSKTDLNTFSAIYDKGQFGDESEFIMEYKSLLKNMFFTTPTAETLMIDLNDFVRAHAEPVPSTSPYAQFKVMELARKHVVVTLDGQGADEELAGYHYFYGFFFKDLLKSLRFSKFVNEVTLYSIKHKSLFGLKSLVFFLLPEYWRTNTRIIEKAYLNKNFVSNYNKSNNISGHLYASSNLNDALLDHFEYKLEHLLKWEDLNSMWFSIEARVPFLDFRLVERILATSSDLLIKNGTTKHILREAMKGALPEKIRTRHDKIGFGTPQDEWFRTPLWESYINELLKSESFKSRNLIDPVKAQKLFTNHLKRKINISKEIWKWTHLELWYRKFID